EELFQEVFLAVWKSRTRYQPPRPFKSWLFGIAVNLCRAEHRHGKAAPAALDAVVEMVPAAEPSPLDAAIAVETAALVETALLRLPSQQRAVVALRVWNGFSYADIAAMCERTEATVRSHMCHGLAALRKYLEPRLR